MTQDSIMVGLVLFRALTLVVLGCFSSTLGSDDIGRICQDLWNADTNSLIHGIDFDINIQSTASYANKNDVSNGKLFTRVDESRLNTRTWRAFKVMMMIMMLSHLYSFQSSFKFELQKMWLYFYRRKAYRDSSGFEHVFLGELQTKSDGVTQVSGFHNWLQFYLEEKKNNLANYYGYYNAKLYSEPTSIKLQMSWHKKLKPITGFFLGTSPEFELALYTACFKLKPDKRCQCSIGGQTIIIQTYALGNYVGTAYPLV
ncbi:poly(U)-specific endoribonuclease-B [Exaiptasia diaphana]|uniref:Uridylate-specific endoribonuclease n=1 Tax=Exaiptasia diaphana TaxID=2652724 RepID=A0A913YJY2_EXADI|nr:poly(U)-specific endoribonuclease-B [Exaiptasia diaphana]